MLEKRLSLLAIMMICPSAGFAAQTYSVTLLPNPSGSSESIPLGVTSAGEVGVAIMGDPNSLDRVPLPIIWQASQASVLPIPVGYNGQAFGINDSGDVIGSIAAIGTPDELPVLWHNGQMQLLSTSNMPNGRPFAINNIGVTVGTIVDSAGSNFQAVLWNGGQVTTLGNFQGAQSTATSVNDQGQILVEVDYSDHRESWVWNKGVLSEIPSLGGSIGGSDINNLGDIVGSAQVTGGTADGYGFLSQNGITKALPSLLEDSTSSALALNDSDQIVGNGYAETTGIHALLWDGGKVYDLNNLIPADSGWKLDEAMDIGNDGTIVGYGQFNGQVTGFLLTPVTASAVSPEPGSASLLLLGTALLLRKNRRVGAI